jgi:MarR family
VDLLAGHVSQMPDVGAPDSGSARREWTLITNHGAVLVAIADQPTARVDHIAERVGITPRATLSIIADLVAAGYVRRDRIGRRNRYSIDPSKPLRHPAVATTAHVADLLAALDQHAGR